MGACFNKDTSDVKNLKELSTVSDMSFSNVMDPHMKENAHKDGKKKNTTQSVDKQIDQHMKNNAYKDAKIIKLLLLGSGSSGKSTLFRQIESIHSDQKENDFFVNLATIRSDIRMNCIEGIIKLLKRSEKLSKEPYNINNCTIDVSDKNISDAVQAVVDLKTAQECWEEDIDYTNGGKHIQFLWQLDQIKQVFKHRNFFSLPENLDYFFDKITEVMDDDYVPIREDVINARVKTTGITERTYFIRRTQFNMFDVGGQRNERKKWIQLFENVNAVLFVSALNHYCSVLFEDETVNAMKESLTLFEETVNSPWFPSKKTQWVMFLNKNDLFIQRLKIDKIPLTFCFDEYDGTNYDGNDEEQFDICYQEAVKFIQKKYLEKINDKNTRNMMSIHVTVATNRSNVGTMFETVTSGILRKNLQTIGVV